MKPWGSLLSTVEGTFGMRRGIVNAPAQTGLRLTEEERQRDRLQPFAWLNGKISRQMRELPQARPPSPEPRSGGWGMGQMAQAAQRREVLFQRADEAFFFLFSIFPCVFISLPRFENATSPQWHHQKRERLQSQFVSCPYPLAPTCLAADSPLGSYPSCQSTMPAITPALPWHPGEADDCGKEWRSEPC